MTGASGVGVCVKGSSAVVVILVGEGCKGTPTRGQAPGAWDQVRKGPSPANRNRTCATAATASRAGATTHEPGPTSWRNSRPPTPMPAPPRAIIAFTRAGRSRVRSGNAANTSTARAARRVVQPPQGPWSRGYDQVKQPRTRADAHPYGGRLPAWHGAGLVLPVPDR